MPRIPSLSTRKVIALLLDHGFVLDRIRGSHHIFYNPETKRRVTIPVHGKDLPRGTLLEILKQAGISRGIITK